MYVDEKPKRVSESRSPFKDELFSKDANSPAATDNFGIW